jgi:translation initiation factor IF-2
MVKKDTDAAGTENKKTLEKALNSEDAANPGLNEGEGHEIKGSTITMQGVSGKIITGSVVVIKKAKPPKESPKEDKEEIAPPVELPIREETTPVVSDAPESLPPSKEPEEVIASSEDKVVPTPRQQGEFVRPNPAKSPTSYTGGTQATPGRAGDKPARADDNRRPYTPAGRPGTRPSGFPPRTPGYTPTDRRSGADKPKFERRPEGETKEKIPETPKINFAQRNAYDKGKLNTERKDVKKDPSKTFSSPRDKHNELKKQRAVLATTGVSDVLQDDTLLDTILTPQGSGRTKFKNSRRRHKKTSTSPMVKAVLTHVTLPETLTVKELAEAIKKTSAEVIKKLIKFGIMATLNQELDYDTAAVVVEEFGITAQKAVVITEEDILFDDTEDKDEQLVTRPPVVVVMGHVDHGKTSLLDKIRSASVATGEAGGITQHIGAYMVKLKDRNITFLDTPGHEAFTTMRARGAQVTDIAILVVAADDGVMPQTIEAINHAKSAGVQVIVAINKIDKPGANVDRVKQELSENGIIPEEWGGNNIMVPVSAMTGENMDELLEMVLLAADMLELKSNPDKQAKGTVIEAKLDKNKGPVATLLVQRGTLKPGDTIVTGAIIGRVRVMTDEKGAVLKKAGPSVPVEITGLPEVPEAGEIFYAIEDEKVAKSLADKRRIKIREQQLKSSSKMSLENLFTRMEAGEVKELNLIVKADVQGSVEAVTQSFEKLNEEGSKEVRVRVIHGGVGTVTESDIRLAEVSNAIIIGFNVRPTANVSEMAESSGVDMRMYRIIYQAIEEIQAAMKGMLSKKFKESVTGHIEIRQTFKVSGIGTIGGGYVTDGKIIRSSDIRLLRNGIIVHEGKLASLKRFKDDVREVAAGFECGLSVEKYNDIKEGDVIEAYEMKEIESE